VMVHSVQPCAIEPLLVSVSVRKGHSIEPLIRDSHAFALCALHPDDKLIPRKFAEHEAPDHPGDPFDSLPTRILQTGSPVLERATVALDCEVVRHFDLEADHELYVGHVVAALIAS
ncbi:MAG: flavin reductase, partial [Phycisphaerales bacterium]|nr:flavin reductase [Phycisphaerales bacterium]